MIKKNIQARLITDPSNIRYLSNFTGSSGFMLITKSKKFLFTDFRYIERAQNSIFPGIEIVNITRLWRNPQEIQKNWQKILNKLKVENLGIEEHQLSVSRYKHFKKLSPGLKFTNISGELEKIREQKNKSEIAKIRKSQQINEKVFLEIKKIIQQSWQKNLKPSEEQLAWKIRELGHQYGAEDVSFSPIVAFGKNSALPHHEPGKNKLKTSDIVLVDMGMKYQGYCSDMTRCLLPPTPSKKQLEIYQLVLQAQMEAIKKIKAGISGQEADHYSRCIIEEAGYGEFYGHAGGHGIGLDIHESPSLSANYKKEIQENTIITVEPGIYLPGEFGVRIEDMLLVKKSGNQNLTRVKK